MGIIIACFLVLLVSSAYVDARLNVEIMSFRGEDLPQESTCASCLEVSRKAEKTLSDPELFKEASKLSGDTCHILPPETKSKCLHKSEAYIQQTRMFLGHLFHEENLCNKTGLCRNEYIFQTNNILISSMMIPSELTDSRSCTACRNSVNEILAKLKQRKLKMRIMDALLESCEEAEDNEEQCKQLVYKYATPLMSKVGKLKPNDLCRMMELCDEGFYI